MNWTFHAVTNYEADELIHEYSQLAASGIAVWLDEFDKGLVEYQAKQPEAYYSEKPKDFFSPGPWYSYRTTVWGPGGCLNPPEYDVTVKQTFYPVFNKAVWDKEMKKRLRVRKIGKVEPIS